MVTQLLGAHLSPPPLPSQQRKREQNHGAFGTKQQPQQREFFVLFSLELFLNQASKRQISSTDNNQTTTTKYNVTWL